MTEDEGSDDHLPAEVRLKLLVQKMKAEIREKKKDIKQAQSLLKQYRNSTRHPVAKAFVLAIRVLGWGCAIGLALGLIMILVHH